MTAFGAWRWLAAAVLLAAPAACTATVVPPDGLSDARSRAMELERRVAELEARNAELAAQLAAARDVEAAPPGAAGPDAEVLEATPRLVSLSGGGASSEWSSDAAGDARPAVVYLAVEPRDGMSRVIQVSGACEVNVAFVDPAGEVRSLGRRAYRPKELRAAWRSGFMGTHYALEVPVQVPAGMARGPWSVSVSVTDGWTGRIVRWAGTVAPPAASPR